MKKILATNPTNTTALVARIALAIVVFPHGAQKLFGWFGGNGFDGTMGFLTGMVGLPYIIALLVILIEVFAALFLVAGFATRVAAFGVIANFIGVIAVSNFNFFMNWAGKAGMAEGLEYFILLFGLALICLIAGGGRASVDAAMANRTADNIKSLKPTI